MALVRDLSRRPDRDPGAGRARAPHEPPCPVQACRAARGVGAGGPVAGEVRRQDLADGSERGTQQLRKRLPVEGVVDGPAGPGIVERRHARVEEEEHRRELSAHVELIRVANGEVLELPFRQWGRAAQRDVGGSVLDCPHLCAGVCSRTEPLGLSQPTVSHHLKVPREAGMVSRDERGSWAYYRVLPEALEALRAVLG